MLNVEFSDEAELEYNQIGQFIAEDNIYYSNEVLNKIDKSIDTICDFPFIGKKIGKNTQGNKHSGGVRLIVEPKYRYKIAYITKEEYIYILSIFKYKNLWE